jgi:large subunit ribosomal protein L23
VCCLLNWHDGKSTAAQSGSIRKEGGVLVRFAFQLLSNIVQLSSASSPISNFTTPRPNFVLTLLRTPNNPPNFATFLVPLSLNKLDLRDYLFHAYGIRVHGVRSYIQMQKIQQDKPGSKRPKPRKWFRPKSIKKMMVEMERPFVWPEEPKELDAYVNIPMRLKRS